MKFNPIGLSTHERFEGEIDLPPLQMTVSDHTCHPHGIQWRGDGKDATSPVPVQTVAHVAFEVEDLGAELVGKKVIIAPNRKNLTTKSTKDTKGHK